MKNTSISGPYVNPLNTSIKKFVSEVQSGNTNPNLEPAKVQKWTLAILKQAAKTAGMGEDFAKIQTTGASGTDTGDLTS